MPQAARCEVRQRNRPYYLPRDTHAVVKMQRGSAMMDNQPCSLRYGRDAARYVAREPDDGAPGRLTSYIKV